MTKPTRVANWITVERTTPDGEYLWIDVEVAGTVLATEDEYEVEIDFAQDDHGGRFVSEPEDLNALYRAIAEDALVDAFQEAL